MKTITIKNQKKLLFLGNIKQKLGKNIDLEKIKGYISAGIGLSVNKDPLKKRTDDIRNLYSLYKKSTDEVSKLALKDKIDELKLGLPCVYNVNIEGKSTKSKVTEYNGLITLDFDDVTSHSWGKLENDPFILFMFKSPSKGIKAIVQLDIPDGELKQEDLIEFVEKFAFDHLQEYFLKTYNLQIDVKCRNINRACFLPIGSDVYYNEDCSVVELWSKFKPSSSSKSLTKSKSKPSATSSLLFTKSLEHLTSSGIVAFDDYNEWLNLGFLLYGYINNPTVAGQMFHNFSKLSSKYNEKEVEEKWKEIVKTGYDPNKLGIKWFYRLMETKYGFNDKNNVYTSFKWVPSDIPEIFSKHMKYNLVLEEVSKQYYIQKGDDLVRLDDIEMNQLLKDFRDSYLSLDKRTLEEYLFTKDMITYRNFIREKLDRVKTSNRSFFDSIFDHIHTKDNKMTAKIFYRWMLGAMKNLFGEYGTYYDEIIILKGEQMIGKSWFVSNALTKPFSEFTTTSFDYKDQGKDNKKLLSSYMFVVDDELSMARRSEIEAVKKATSTPHVQLRLPYSKTWDNFKRISSFIGLTNSDDVFNDDTGGRRFLVCDIKKIDREIYNLDWDSIWGFIYNEWCSGKDPILDSDITREELLKHADEYRYKNDVEDYLQDNFEVVEKPTISLDEIRSCIVTDFQLTHKQFNMSNRHIANKLKSIFKVSTTVVTVGGKSIRKYPLKYKGTISNPTTITNTKVIYRSENIY
jgi:hypothetical protein